MWWSPLSLREAHLHTQQLTLGLFGARGSSSMGFTMPILRPASFLKKYVPPRPASAASGSWHARRPCVTDRIRRRTPVRVCTVPTTCAAKAHVCTSHDFLFEVASDGSSEPGAHLLVVRALPSSLTRAAEQCERCYVLPPL